MRLHEKILTGVATALVMLGVASIESTPLIIPVIMILGGGAWLIYASNAFKWD